MFRVNDTDFYIGEEIIITEGEYVNVTGYIVELYSPTASVRVELGDEKYINVPTTSIAPKNKIYIVLSELPYGGSEFICITHARNEDEVRIKVPRKNIEIVELKSLDTFGVKLTEPRQCISLNR